MKEMLNILNVLLQYIKFFHMDSLGEINNSFSYCLDNVLNKMQFIAHCLYLKIKRSKH